MQQGTARAGLTTPLTLVERHDGGLQGVERVDEGITERGNPGLDAHGGVAIVKAAVVLGETLVALEAVLDRWWGTGEAGDGAGLEKTPAVERVHGGWVLHEHEASTQACLAGDMKLG